MTNDPRPRRCRPNLESLEVRDLPSAMAVHAKAASHGATPDLNLMVARETAAYAGATSAALSNAVAGKKPTNTPPWVNEGFLQSLVSQLYGPITTTSPITVGNQTFPAGTYAVPQPTAAEVRRETFWLQFQGTYTIGVPRFSNQSATIHIYSNGRSANSLMRH